MVEALLEAGEAVTVVDEVVDVEGEHPVADEVEQLAAQRVRSIASLTLPSFSQSTRHTNAAVLARGQEEPAPRSSSSPTDTLAFS